MPTWWLYANFVHECFVGKIKSSYLYSCKYYGIGSYAKQWCTCAKCILEEMPYHLTASSNVTARTSATLDESLTFTLITIMVKVSLVRAWVRARVKIIITIAAIITFIILCTTCVILCKEIIAGKSRSAYSCIKTSLNCINFISDINFSSEPPPFLSACNVN